MNECISYVGLDVHKDTISVAVAEGSKRAEVREYGRISNTPAALKRLLSKLCQPGLVLRFCYEAGPCGYGIQRQLSAAGHDCVVVAPSLIPRKPINLQALGLEQAADLKQRLLVVLNIC